MDEDADERAQRIKALEEQMKLGEIDRETFDRLVQEIAGGDISATHLVRGLDFKLLERTRRGEDVLNEGKDVTEAEEPEELEHELEELEEKEIAPIVREKVEKKGVMAPPPPPVTGIKRTRDAILAELKASRKAAAEAAAEAHTAKYPSLGPAFQKIGQKNTSRLEVDELGREVLIIVDENGKEKRKVRKQKHVEPEASQESQAEATEASRAGQPEPKRKNKDDEKKEESGDDEDIFAGVGSDYNPLAGLEEDDDGEEDSEDDKKQEESPSAQALADLIPDEEEGPTEPTTTKPPAPITGRSIFEKPPSIERNADSAGTAAVLAALKKVRTMDKDSPLLQTEEEARLKKRLAMISTSDRDMEDLDLGFGSNRFDDAEEMEQEGKRVKLSEWNGGADGDDDSHERKGGKPRKRGPKKRKGDKNNADDVLKAMERQKKKDVLG